MTTCYCGERIELIDEANDLWQHISGGDPKEPFYCYEEEDHMDPESRCSADPDPDGSAS